MVNGSDIPILSLLLLIPLAGAVLIALFDGRHQAAVRRAALAIAGLELLLSLTLWSGFDPAGARFQFIEKAPWIPGVGASYFLAVDGMSLLLVLLTTFTAVLAVLCSMSAVHDRVKGFMICLLIMETGMLGVFMALDMILFFVFWEIGLVPMYFLIGIWGGERKLYATIKFFLYTLFGSVFMLVGILAVYFFHGRATGVYTFDLLLLYEAVYPANLQWWVFLAMFLGFAIKVPLFPFHTWLPDAHVEAPTAGSVILAGVLLKMGTYAFLRFNLPLLPDASRAFMPLMLALAVIGIIYGALLALAQTDLKKLVAYSSVSHLGFVMAGIFAMNQQGIDGGVLQMVNHGLSTGALFLIVGMLYERKHSRMIDDFGGLARVMPVFAALTVIVVFSSIGLPGTNGFVGELLILLGVFKTSIPAAALAATGVILGAVYMLRMVQHVLLGAVKHPSNEKLRDLNAREVFTLAAVVALIFWIGLYPKPFLDVSSAGTTHLIQGIQAQQPQAERHRTAATLATVQLSSPVAPQGADR